MVWSTLQFMQKTHLCIEYCKLSGGGAIWMDGGPDCCWNSTAIGLVPCCRSWVVTVFFGVCMWLSGAVGFRGLLNIIRQRTGTVRRHLSGSRVWALMPAAASQGCRRATACCFQGKKPWLGTQCGYYRRSKNVLVRLAFGVPFWMDGGHDCCWNSTAIGLAPCRHSWVVAVGVWVCMWLSGAVGFRGLLNIRQRTWTVEAAAFW